MEMVQTLGGEVVVGKRQGSLQSVFQTPTGKAVYPLHLWASGAQVSPSFSYLLKRPGLAEEAARRRIYDLFVQAVGKLNGQP